MANMHESRVCQYEIGYRDIKGEMRFEAGYIINHDCKVDTSNGGGRPSLEGKI